MRHGESTANVEGICAGGETVHPLTDAGRAQATEAGKILRLSGMTLDHIVHSRQARAAETAELVGKALAIGPERILGNPDWRERGFGEWEGVPFLDIYPHLEAWIDPPGGESLQALFARVTAALAALPRGLNLIVSHGGLWHVLNKMHGVSQAAHIGNADIFAVTIDGDASPSILTERIVGKVQLP